MLTDTGFKKAYAFLLSEFKDEVSEMQIQTHKSMLSEDGITDEQLMTAVKTLIRDRKFAKFPRYAEILEAIKGNPDDTAILALKTLESEMARSGAYNSVCFKDESIMAAVIGLGGWIAICRTPSEEWKFIKKEFLQLYKAISKNPNALSNSPRYLVGLNEHQNRISGYDDFADNEDVKLIGFSDVKNKTIKVCQIGELRKAIGIEAPKQNKIMQMLSAGIKRIN